MDNNKSLEELKQDLVSEIKKRVEDKILEKSNADLLEKLINKAETETEAMDIAALGTTYKRTGFHFDKRLERISNNIKYKTKNERLSFVNDASRPTHQLIIGDNYDALQNLLITHKNSIDVIYIDPPYGKDNMGDFAQTNYENSITRDNLLSMLYPRLLMAKRLLTSEGVIFCSIDDKNQAYVKCLFDEVFGEENFVGEYIWYKKLTGGYDNKNINIQHEYILVYCKQYSPERLAKDKDVETKYTLQDENGKKYKWDSLWNVGGLTYSKSLDYPIKAPDGTDIWPIGEKGKAFWLWSKEKVEVERDKLLFKKDKNDDWKVYKKIYASDAIVSGSMLKPEIVKGNTNSSAEIKSIFDTKLFDYAKPSELIKYIVERCPKSSATILDFFAGSGTTGQAVMELNREDGGNRTFILCTNNEVTETNPNGIAYDVTAKRLKRVMSGKCYDGTDDFPWIKNNKPYMDNLNVYEIAQVSKTDHKKGETAFDKIDETCYGLPKFEKLTDKIAWICSNFENATKDIEKKEGE